MPSTQKYVARTSLKTEAAIRILYSYSPEDPMGRYIHLHALLISGQ